MAAVDVDAVTSLIQDVAERVILPRHQALSARDVEEKVPGELVTVADREAEALLVEGLGDVLPGVPVVGEEAAHADPSLLELVGGSTLLWLVDPLDGTANFVAGSPDFAVMVALVHLGHTVASWIVRPADGRQYVAELGAGAYVDGERLLRPPAPTALAELTGVALTRFLTPEQRTAVEQTRPHLAHLGPGRVCAGVDYPLIAEAHQDFALFWRTLPWDHAPGALLLSEAGGCVAHLDGAPYKPGRSRPGLLAAADVDTHERLLAAFSPLLAL